MLQPIKARLASSCSKNGIKAAETAAQGVSIFASESKSDVAKAYAGLAKEVIADVRREKAKICAEQCR